MKMGAIHVYFDKKRSPWLFIYLAELKMGFSNRTSILYHILEVTPLPRLSQACPGKVRLGELKVAT